MSKHSRETIQQVFIQVCRDSRFSMDAADAAHFAAKMLDCDPLEIWFAMSSFSIMEEIARGTHPRSLHPCLDYVGNVFVGTGHADKAARDKDRA
jgi:hypothetical protein